MLVREGEVSVEAYKEQIYNHFETVCDMTKEMVTGLNNTFTLIAYHLAKYNCFKAMEKLPEEAVGDDRGKIMNIYTHLMADTCAQKVASRDLGELAELELDKIKQLTAVLPESPFERVFWSSEQPSERPAG